MLLHNEEEVKEILAKLENAEYQVCDVKKGERVKKAPFPLLPVPCSRRPPRF